MTSSIRYALVSLRYLSLYHLTFLLILLNIQWNRIYFSKHKKRSISFYELSVVITNEEKLLRSPSFTLKISKLIISFIWNSLSVEYYKWLCTCLSSYPSHMWVPYMNIRDATWHSFRHICKIAKGDCGLRLVCVCLSTCPCETTQLPMDRFSWN